MDIKLKDLERQMKELTASKRTLAQELEVQKQKYESSQKTIKRQQKELKEREQSELIPTPVPAKPTGAAPVNPPRQGAVPPAAAPQNPLAPDAPKPPVVGALPAATLVDVNKASEADLVLTLSLGKEDSQKVIKGRPYKTKDELVTRAGLSKTTFDRIKDRLSITP